MKTTSILLTLTLVMLSGCAQQETQEIEADQFGLTIGKEDEEQAAQALKMKEVACENSGGTFSGETCECPDGTYGDDWPLYSYEEETGYCIDAFGVPGGMIGDAEKEKNILTK